MRRGKKKGVSKARKKVVQEDTEVEFICTLPGEGVDQDEVVQEHAGAEGVQDEGVQEQAGAEGVQEQAGAEVDPEQQNHEQRNDEQQQTEEPEGEVELSTNEETEVRTNRKRKRGPTRMKDLAKDPNSRVHVDFNALGEAYGEGSVKLSSYLGPLVREHVPVTVEGWKKLSEEVKTVLWKSVQVKISIL